MCFYVSDRVWPPTAHYQPLVGENGTSEGGRVCQRSDHVDWFWLGHVRSISLREWKNVLGGMEGCGVIYTSGPWSACNGSSETTGFPMQAWERKCPDCWWMKHMLFLMSLWPKYGAIKSFQQPSMPQNNIKAIQNQHEIKMDSLYCWNMHIPDLWFSKSNQFSVDKIKYFIFFSLIEYSVL